MNSIERLLPNYNCGACGYKSCKEFAVILEEANIELCPHMARKMFQDERSKIIELSKNRKEDTPIYSLLDNKKCDFILAPLHENEPSCREYLLPLNTKNEITVGDYISWRPLGCPIKHFGAVFEIEPLLGVLPQGLKVDRDTKDIGIAMVLAFDGRVVEGRIPDVEETVVFLPEYCMMQKAHSGIIVEVIGDKVRIEGIALTVWGK